MPVKDPYHVSYDDLIESTENRIKWMEANYPKMKLLNTIKEWTATHNIAVEKAKLKLFKKFKREPQMDLFTEHQKAK